MSSRMNNSAPRNLAPLFPSPVFPSLATCRAFTLGSLFIGLTAAASTAMVVNAAEVGLAQESGAATTVASRALASQALLSQTPITNGEGPTAGALKPRVPMPKIDPVSALHSGINMGLFKPNAEEMALPGTIIVKFRDEVRARLNTGADMPVVSEVGADLTGFLAAATRSGASITPWINRSPAELAALEARAEARTGTEAPDLAGFALLSGVDRSQLFNLARAINGMDVVEFATIGRDYANFQCGENPQPCFLPNCQIPSRCNPNFGTEFTDYGCSNPECCAAVAALDPSCGDDVLNGWDPLCAGIANVVCAGLGTPYSGGGGFNPCLTDPINFTEINPVFTSYYYNLQDNDCFLPHGQFGCSRPGCCFQVCTFDPSCCEQGWDETCVILAASNSFTECARPDITTETSPNLVAENIPYPGTGVIGGNQGMQFYNQTQPRADTLLPVDIQTGTSERWAGIVPYRTGFYGEMLGMSGNGIAFEELKTFQDFVWNTYQGAGGKPGSPNPNVYAGGIKIGVLETSAFLNHEEFILSGPADNPLRPFDGPLLKTPRVIQAEENQTAYLLEQGAISAMHGTNVLGVLFAADNGFGVSGPVPNAQGYFYPIVSVEEGSRAQNAVISALEDFQAGDVMNFSWGFTAGYPYFTGNYQPVTSDLGFALLIALASDLGITAVVAAGGDQLGGGPILGFGDSGAILVGAARTGNVVAQTNSGEIAVEVEQGPQASLGGKTYNFNPPGLTGCEQNIFDVTINPVRWKFSNFTGTDGSEDSTVDLNAPGDYIPTAGYSVTHMNSLVANPSNWLFNGINDAPSTGPTPELQVDKLRSYTQNFGGTSASAAIITGVIASAQAASRQFYGSPLAPRTLRALLTNPLFNFDQCPADSGGGAVGSWPNLTQTGPQILSTPFADGNLTDIVIHTGTRPVGYFWNSFLIKSADENYLRIESVPKNAGSSVAGLAYVASGQTTDVQANLTTEEETPKTLGLRTTSRATRAGVYIGGFAKNWVSGRYMPLPLTVGDPFLTVGAADYYFAVPDSFDLTEFIQPGTNRIEMRVYTCGIGLVLKHQVWHDLIRVEVNNVLQAP